MQKAKRKFEEKIETINKIQHRNYRKLELPPHFDQHSPELPPITNSLSSPRKINNTSLPLTTLVAAYSSKIDYQYDTIINKTLSQFKNQKINRIIFASPLNRLGKTYYRKNDFKTVQNWTIRKQSEQKNAMNSKRKKQFQDYLQNHVKKHKYGRESYKNMTHGFPQQRNTTFEETDTVYFTAPDQAEKDPLPNSFRRNNKGKTRQRNTQNYGRYSPWREEEKEQEMADWYR